MNGFPTIWTSLVQVVNTRISSYLGWLEGLFVFLRPFLRFKLQLKKSNHAKFPLTSRKCNCSTKWTIKTRQVRVRSGRGPFSWVVQNCIGPLLFLPAHGKVIKISKCFQKHVLTHLFCRICFDSYWPILFQWRWLAVAQKRSTFSAFYCFYAQERCKIMGQKWELGQEDPK